MLNTNPIDDNSTKSSTSSNRRLSTLKTKEITRFEVNMDSKGVSPVPTLSVIHESIPSHEVVSIECCVYQFGL